MKKKIASRDKTTTVPDNPNLINNKGFSSNHDTYYVIEATEKRGFNGKRIGNFRNNINFHVLKLCFIY